MEHKTIIEFFNIKLLEPGTFISDVVMGIACFVFFYKLKKHSFSKFHKHCLYYFLFMALSSTVGAFAHAFYLYFGKSLHFATWISTGIAIYLAQFGMANIIKKEKRRELYILLIKVQLVIYVFLVAFYMDFIVVKINVVLGMLGVVFPIAFYQMRSSSEKKYVYILLGIVLALLPAFFHRVELSFGAIFNMNDLSHFFIIFCQYLLYLGFKHYIINYKDAEYSEVEVRY